MKTRLMVLLLGSLVLFPGSPAGAYVALVLHPEGYVYSPDGDELAIEAEVNETFTLFLSIATDTTVYIAGLNDALISFDSAEVEVTHEDSPVDANDKDPVFEWSGPFETNEADNLLGTLTYGKSMALGQSITLPPGQYSLGSIEWRSLSSGQYVIAVDGQSNLLAGDKVENLLTHYQGCAVNPDTDSGDDDDTDSDDSGDTDSDGNGGTDSGNGGSSDEDSDSESGGSAGTGVVTSCFIATAAFGSEETEEVAVLRELRDRYLLKTNWGRRLVRTYYRLSPPLAEKIREREHLKLIVRITLRPLIRLSKMLTDNS